MLLTLIYRLIPELQLTNTSKDKECVNQNIADRWSGLRVGLGSCCAVPSGGGLRGGLEGRAGLAASAGTGASPSSSDSLTSVVLPDSGSATLAAGARRWKSRKRLEGAAVWVG